MKNRNTFFWVLGVMVLFSALLFWKNIKSKVVQEDDFPLKKGSTGENVIRLQKYINSRIKEYLVLKNLVVDGIFGPKTEGACLTILGTKEISKDEFKKII